MADKKYQISKILLIGDVGTGKTSFLTQLIHRVPERLPKPTTHLSVFTMRISKPPTVIQIWDSPGDAKYYFQTLGSISKFNAVLIFVDVTNEYTYDRARIIADRNKYFNIEIGIYTNSGMDIHIIESKIEIVEKDPIKRKVSTTMLRKIIDKYNGGIFQYRQNTSVETIIQEIIEWKNKR